MPDGCFVASFGREFVRRLQVYMTTPTSRIKRFVRLPADKYIIGAVRVACYCKPHTPSRVDAGSRGNFLNHERAYLNLDETPAYAPDKGDLWCLSISHY